MLTTVDIEAENQRAAKEAFTEAGIAPSRYRLINGSAAEVLPRLTDAAYDLVFVDADKTRLQRLLRAGACGCCAPAACVAFDNMLWHDRVADPSAARRRDHARCASSAKTVRDDERLVPALLPVGDGLLVAVKR